MLAHQFILVFVSAFKRFESVLLTAPARLRQMLPRKSGDAKMQERETEQAA